MQDEQSFKQHRQCFEDDESEGFAFETLSSRNLSTLKPFQLETIYFAFQREL
jgi:hypothetical protein